MSGVVLAQNKYYHGTKKNYSSNLMTSYLGEGHCHSGEFIDSDYTTVRASFYTVLEKINYNRNKTYRLQYLSSVECLITVPQ